MFYQLSPEFAEIALQDRSPDTFTLGVISAEELPQVASQLGYHEAVVAECLQGETQYRNTVDEFDEYTFGLIDLLDAGPTAEGGSRLAFFLQKTLLLVVVLRDQKGDFPETLLQAIRKRFRPETVTLEKLTYLLLEGAILHNPHALTSAEADISALEEKVAQGRTSQHFTSEIYERKKRLLALQDYYEQMVSLGEDLQENESGLFPDNSLHYLGLFTARAERLSGRIERLISSLNELREAHQAMLDYNLNSVMKVISVITTIFLPLTLLVGWYGMNFATMPELEWEYGYLFVIVLSVATVALCLLLFKKKNLF